MKISEWPVLETGLPDLPTEFSSRLPTFSLARKEYRCYSSSYCVFIYTYRKGRNQQPRRSVDRRLSARASIGGLPEVCSEGPCSGNLDRLPGYYPLVGAFMDRLTVLLGYSAEGEFCVSSSEFTSVAVGPALVNLLVLAGIATARAQRLPASQRVILRLRSNWTRQLPVRPGITLPDVRTDDAVRRLAAARPPAQDPAAAPTDSPACPCPGIGASWCRDNTPQMISGDDTDWPR